MKIRTWCLETIPIRTYSTGSHSNLVNRTYCPKPIDLKFTASGSNCADNFTKRLGKTKTQQHFPRLSAMRGCQGLPDVSQGGNGRMVSYDPQG